MCEAVSMHPSIAAFGSAKFALARGAGTGLGSVPGVQTGAFTRSGRNDVTGSVVAGAIAVLSLLLADVALARTVIVDELWTHPEFSRFRLQRVAVLPAITLDDDRAVSRLVPERWRKSIQATGHTWIPSDVCYDRLGPTPASRVAAFHDLSEQVRRAGKFEPARARGLARQLDADALLLLRVDRWERQIGAREMAYVDLTVSLVDSTGTCLWRCVSRSRVEVTEPHRTTPLPPPAQGPSVGIQRVPGASSGSTSGSSSGSGNSQSSGSGRAGSGGSSSSASSGFKETRIVRDDMKSYVVPLEEPLSASAQTSFRAAVDSMFTVLARKFPGAPLGPAAP